MSYPALLSPLMDSTGLIATAALNTAAQTALALSATNAADIVVLQDTSLLASGGSYTGLPATNLSIDGSVQANTFNNADSSFTVDATGKIKCSELDVGTATLTHQTLTLTDGAGSASIYAHGNEMWVTGDALNVEGAIQANTAFSMYAVGSDATFYVDVPSNSVGSSTNATLSGFGAFDATSVTTPSNVLTGTLTDGSASVGTSGQILSSTGSKVAWVDAPASSSNWSLYPATQAVDMANYAIDNARSVYTKDLFAISSDGLSQATLNNLNIQLPDGSANACTIDNAGNIQTNGSVNVAIGGGVINSETFRFWGDAQLYTDSSHAIIATDTPFRTNGALLVASSLVDSASSSGNPNQILSSAGSSVVWVDPPASSWVGTATSNLNMGTYSITGTANKGSSINIGSDIAMTTHTLQADTLRADTLISTTGSISSNTLTAVYINGVTSIDGKGTDPILVLKNLDVGSNTLNAGASTLASAIITGTLTDGSASVGTSGQILSSTGSATAWVAAPAAAVRPVYDYWVAPNGSDSASGSQVAPFQTIQHAISLCETFTDGIPRIVNVMSGSYTENLIFSKSRISILGQGSNSHDDIGTSIYGNITVSLSSGNSDLNNNNIYITGFLINGNISDTTSSYVHRLFFSRCQLFGSQTVLNMNPVGDYRLFLDTCTISNSNTADTTPLVNILGSGMISITNCQLEAHGNNQTVMYIGGTVRFDTVALSTFTSDSTTSTATAIVRLANTNYTSIKAFTQCGFIYSSNNTKTNTGPAYACGILIDAPSSSNMVVSLIANIFSMNGLATGQNCVLFTNTGSGVVLFGNNVSTSSPAGTSASGISGTLNVNKFAYTAVL